MNLVWWAFGCGLCLGAFLGMFAMCLLQIARGE
jgi:hypothetical protein